MTNPAIDIDFAMLTPPPTAPRRPRAFRLVRNTARGPVTVASTDSADVVKVMRAADPALVVEVSPTTQAAHDLAHAMAVLDATARLYAVDLGSCEVTALTGNRWMVEGNGPARTVCTLLEVAEIVIGRSA